MNGLVEVFPNCLEMITKGNEEYFTSQLNLTNKTDNFIVFKLYANTKVLFSANPSTSFIPPKQNVSIAVKVYNKNLNEFIPRRDKFLLILYSTQKVINSKDEAKATLKAKDYIESSKQEIIIDIIIRDDIIYLKDEISSKTQEIAKLKNQISQKNDENSRLLKNLKELERKVKQKDEHIKILEKKLNELSLERNRNNINFNVVNNNNVLYELYAKLNEKEKMQKLKHLSIGNIKKDDIINDDKFIVVNFTSIDQRINTSILCKTSSLFAEVENELYEKYPDYKENAEEENYFLGNGKKMKRLGTMAQNGFIGYAIILMKNNN